MTLPLLGAHFATPQEGPFPHLIDLFKRGRFDAAKFMIPPGFTTQPADVQQVIDAGAREIILRTEDDQYDPTTVIQHFVNRGFLSLVDDNPSTSFFLEVGNEQNLARDSHQKPRPLDPWVGRFWQIRTRLELSWITRPNLKWIASMPTDLNEVKIYLTKNSEGAIADLYDGIGAHVYGHFNLHRENIANGSDSWLDIVEHLLKHTSIPVYITEFGINHPDMDPREKANRYVTWLKSLDRTRIPSAYVYWLGTGERHPQYQVTESIANVLGARKSEIPMTPQKISLDSPLTIVPTVDDALVLRFLERHGQPYAYSVNQRREFARLVVQIPMWFMQDVPTTIGRIMLETNNLRFTGDVRPDQFNFGGIGATGGVRGATFPSIKDGLIAVCAHTMAYTHGPVDNWPDSVKQYQHATPRYNAVLQRPEAGSVRRVGDLGRGTWATDPHYDEKIVSRTNQLLALA